MWSGQKRTFRKGPSRRGLGLSGEESGQGWRGREGEVAAPAIPEPRRLQGRRAAGQAGLWVPLRRSPCSQPSASGPRTTSKGIPTRVSGSPLPAPHCDPLDEGPAAPGGRETAEGSPEPKAGETSSPGSPRPPGRRRAAAGAGSGRQVVWETL